MKQDRVRQPLVFAFCAVMVWAFVAYSLFSVPDTQRHYRAIPVIVDVKRSQDGAVTDVSVRTPTLLERGNATRGPTGQDEWWLEVATSESRPADHDSIVVVVTFAESARLYRFEPSLGRYAWCELLKENSVVWDEHEFASVLRPAVIDALVDSLAAEGFPLSETVVEQIYSEAMAQDGDAYLPKLWAGLGPGDIQAPPMRELATGHIAISIIGFVIAAIAGGVYGWYACPQPPDPNARSRFI